MIVILGLPRSFSTGLCDLFFQNDSMQVEHTNPLCSILGSVVLVTSTSPDIKGSLLPQYKDETEAKLFRSMKAYIDAWNNTDKVVVNKSRGWAGNIRALKHLYPDAKILVTVRDNREVFASFVKRDDDNPLLNDAQGPLQKTLLTKANSMFSDKGMIGSCLAGIQDIIQRNQDVFFVKYEDFCRHPKEMMHRIYCYLELPEFEHDFDNIVSTATDPDHLYLGKYPHKVEGTYKLEARPICWPKFMNDEIGEGIMTGREWFNHKFGYRMAPKKPEAERAPGPGLAELEAIAQAAAEMATVE